MRWNVRRGRHRPAAGSPAPGPQPWEGDEAAVRLYRLAREWDLDPLPYAPYAYGLFAAARTARATGATGLTAIETGVAGGNGLVSLEAFAEVVARTTGVTVRVVGLDTGRGMPDTSDPRDVPFALPPGMFAMDEAALRERLRGAELHLGRVEDTIGPLMSRIESGELPPLGFVAHDLDTYGGTLATLERIAAVSTGLAPRVWMYFDDLSGYPYTTEVGEAAAIRAFNASRDQRRVGRVLHLEHSLGGADRTATWPRRVHVLHVFDHPDHGSPEDTRMPDLSLGAAPAVAGGGTLAMSGARPPRG